jgi:hypothetical protein
MEKNIEVAFKLLQQRGKEETILREASNSTITLRKIKEEIESAASLRTVQRLVKKCAHLSRRGLKKKPF